MHIQKQKLKVVLIAFMILAAAAALPLGFAKMTNAEALLVKKKIVTFQQRTIKQPVVRTILEDPPNRNCATNQERETDFRIYLTDFRCGTIVDYGNHNIIRHFTLIANDYNRIGRPINISKPDPFENGSSVMPVQFHAWTFNGSVPGPTLRMTEGDHVQITLINSGQSALPHSIHMHSIHSGAIDGVTGPAGSVPPGHSFTYDYIARPAGVYVYHCHMMPIEEHINRGLYGVMIIDPPKDRAPAIEMVMLMTSYSFTTQGLNGSGVMPMQMPPTAAEMQANLSAAMERTDESQFDNQFYTVNGMPFAYTGRDSVTLITNTPYRIYLANMVEFDPVNPFHMHGNMFYYTPSGTLNSSKIYTDIVTLGQGDRGIVEFSIPYAGDYMFHSHINHFADLGWVGFFHVKQRHD